GEFSVTLDSAEYAQPPPAGQAQPTIPWGWLLFVLILLLIMSRGRLLWLPFWLISMRGDGRRGGRGGGGGGGRFGGWGGGGGGGGGFGGFGGGGGFSGGGAG